MEIYGRNSVLEYLRTLRQGDAVSLFIAKNAHGKIIQEIVDQAARVGITPQWVEKKFFEKNLPSAVHQGVFLKLHHEYHASFCTADDLLTHVSMTKGIIIFLDCLTDPHNVGSIIRTAEALGATGVVVSGAHSAPINATVVKASAGATAYLPILKITNAGSFIAQAKSKGLWIIGSSSQGELCINEISNFKPAVIVIGSEGKGVRKSILQKCDVVVRIPLKGKVASLNASVAAGILLFWLLHK